MVGISSPEIGSNIGGLYDSYKQKKDLESAKNMVNEWHPFVSLQKKNDRIDIKMDIKSLAVYYNKTIK